MLAISGLQRGAKAGNLMTIGGGAAMGYSVAPALGMTGLGGGIFGACAGLAAAGLQRGGWSGVGMSTTGGAIIGMQFGGPLGAAIGAGVGFVAGMVRMFIKGAQEKAREKVKATYGDISDKAIPKQIVDTAKQMFGGNLDMAIRSQQIRDIIDLYAISTGHPVPVRGDEDGPAVAGAAAYSARHDRAAAGRSRGRHHPAAHRGTDPAAGGRLGLFSAPFFLARNRLSP